MTDLNTVIPPGNLLYTSSSWSVFATFDDCQHVEGFIRCWSHTDLRSSCCQPF